jgi:hypothetical protein
LTSATGFGAGEVILAFQSTVIGAVLLLIITGIFYTMYTSNTNTIVQLAAPGNLQGRVAGLYSYIFAGSNAPGSLLAGALAEAGGTQLALLVGGGTALASATFGITRFWLRRNKDQQIGKLVKSLIHLLTLQTMSRYQLNTPILCIQSMLAPFLSFSK